jgi:hypothetical protein
MRRTSASTDSSPRPASPRSPTSICIDLDDTDSRLSPTVGDETTDNQPSDLATVRPTCTPLLLDLVRYVLFGLLLHVALGRCGARAGSA